MWSQAATEAAEGEGWWTGEGGAESVVVARSAARRGCCDAMPVNAGSHSSRCVRSRCCDVERVGWRLAGVLCGGGLCDADQNWRGPFLGCRGGGGWAGSASGPKSGVCFGACAGGCATTLSTVWLTVHAQDLADWCEAVLVVGGACRRRCTQETDAARDCGGRRRRCRRRWRRSSRSSS